MRRKITTVLLFGLAMATPGVALAQIDPETKVVLDTLWVLIAAFLGMGLGVAVGRRRPGLGQGHPA